MPLEVERLETRELPSSLGSVLRAEYKTSIAETAEAFAFLETYEISAPGGFLTRVQLTDLVEELSRESLHLTAATQLALEAYRHQVAIEAPGSQILSARFVYGYYSARADAAYRHWSELSDLLAVTADESLYDAAQQLGVAWTVELRQQAIVSRELGYHVLRLRRDEADPRTIILAQIEHTMSYGVLDQQEFAIRKLDAALRGAL